MKPTDFDDYMGNVGAELGVRIMEAASCMLEAVSRHPDMQKQSPEEFMSKALMLFRSASRNFDMMLVGNIVLLESNEATKNVPIREYVDGTVAAWRKGSVEAMKIIAEQGAKA